VTLVGSAQIVLHLGGTPYYEQGARSTDQVDGDISSGITISSNVNTARAGSYTVTYTSRNSAGLSASATRSVSVLAPETRPVPGKTFTFAPKGKQGASFTYTADIPAAGNATLTLTVPNKTTATVKVTNASGSLVLQQQFNTTSTRIFPVQTGRYTITVTIDAANGNASLNLGLVAPAGTETYFPQPERPR